MNRTQQFFIIAILVNVVYLCITFFFFYFTDSFLMNMYNNDYLSFHRAGQIVLEDLPNLYNPSLYLFPFRYLPLSAYFFIPFSILGIELGYFLFQIFNLILNFIILYLIYKIVKVCKSMGEEKLTDLEIRNLKDIFNNPKNETILFQSAIFLIILPQFMNYFLGQINLLVLFFLLTSLLCLLKAGSKNDFLGGLMLGFGILIKPTLILVLPFVIILNYNRKTKKFVFRFKQTITRLSGSLILILISALFFLIYPQMLKDFINVNLAGEYTYNIGGDLEINPSFSLTRIVLIFFELLGLKSNGFLVFFIITLIILIPTYLFFIIFTNHQNNLIIGYFSGIIISLLVYFDSWPHHLVVLTPFMIFFLIFNKNFVNISFFKFIHYLLAFLMVIFWGVFYLTYEFIPFNIGGLALIILLYYNLILYYKKRVF
ncbi:hypothetical protein LCGC14_0404760 [marine sediment metagenome]|uniref:Glycosyltransferase RgtA/B/C/D-like domain-containing protein n=1 Tax=marine sediment metagenome TaxID=412755 RepID=A0A0F9VHN6_9ZZZZ|nr:MAG: hypothetical protein Lokiarch_26720 [Candidatus Lokiarchaeum sp. GC14_75]